MRSRSFLRFALNGEVHEVSGADAKMMLADYLRRRLYLTGTKIVCAEGDCGACTVLFAVPRSRGALRFVPINACITLVAQVDGAHVVTVEALARRGALSPVQQAMVECHGSQCGYCTPGFVMALTGLFDGCQTPPTTQSIKNHLTGNLCRCTGYTPIIETARRIDLKSLTPLAAQLVTKEIRQALGESRAIPVNLDTGDGRIMAPVTLAQMQRWRLQYPDATLLASGTDLGVQCNKGKRRLGDVISLHLLEELQQARKQGGYYHIGAKVSLAAVRTLCARGVPEFSALLNVFAAPQIKNTATLVGNIANASPIGDTLPFLLVADGEVEAVRGRGTRRIPLPDFFRGYREVDLRPGEWIKTVRFRAPRRTEVLRLYKAAARKDLDIAAVSAAFLFEMTKGRAGRAPKVKAARIALGGVAATPVRLGRVEEFLRGKNLAPEVLGKASAMIQEDIQPLSDLRGSAAYRRFLVQEFFGQYCTELQQVSGVRHAAGNS